MPPWLLVFAALLLATAVSPVVTAPETDHQRALRLLWTPSERIQGDATKQLTDTDRNEFMKPGARHGITKEEDP